MNRYVVACVNANGESDFFFCLAEQPYRAMDLAVDNGYNMPFIVYDKQDRCFSALETLFNWESLNGAE